MEHIYDAVILGGGPAGYTAALYCARAGLDTLVLERLSAGGQMALTEQIDNYPGFDEGVDGFELGERMQRGAERFGAKTVLTDMLDAELTGAVKRIKTGEGDMPARCVMIATGAAPRTLGLPGEDTLTGKGVHYCAACDGMRYKGKTAVVMGGGNSAAADALALGRICKKVILVHRRDTLRATKLYAEQLKSMENVEFRWNSVVSALHGEGQLRGVTLQNVQSGEESELFCDALFISIGRSPETALFHGQLALDGAGYIAADESTRTSLPGVFAIGDVRAKAVRQIVTAVADGAVAAHYAEEYLAERRQNGV